MNDAVSFAVFRVKEDAAKAAERVPAGTNMGGTAVRAVP